MIKYHVEQVNIESAKVSKPIKIGSFSDLHLKEESHSDLDSIIKSIGEFNPNYITGFGSYYYDLGNERFAMQKEKSQSYIDTIIKNIGELNPDYITGLGDYYFGLGNERFEMRNELERLLHGLREIAPVILCLGNHDVAIKDESELRKSFRDLESKDIYPLDNESKEFDDVYFSGYFAPRDAYAVSKMSGRKTKKTVEDLRNVELLAKKDKLSVLLCHNPFIVLSSIIKREFPNIYDYDLILSGHCHNGLYSLKNEENLVNRINILVNKLKTSGKHQQLISFLESLKSFGIMTAPSAFTRYARGLHDVNGAQLFISRGVTGQNKRGDSFVSEVNLVHELDTDKVIQKIY